MDAESESLVAVMQPKLINEVRRIARTLHVPRLQRRVCLPFFSRVFDVDRSQPAVCP